MSLQKNVLGTVLRTCSRKPLTGFFRNGCCETDAEDAGEHTACVHLTAEFLEFSKMKGNDLSTPRPEYGFPGLVPGDQWCVCAGRWVEAHQAGVIGPLVLEATHSSLLDYLPLEELQKHAWKASPAIE
jgi:uncharacterized protein (DUF2237 family)